MKIPREVNNTGEIYSVLKMHEVIIAFRINYCKQLCSGTNGTFRSRTKLKMT